MNVFLCLVVHAQDGDPKPMVISGGVQFDDDGSKDFLLGIDYAIADKTWVSAFAGYSDTSDDFAEETFNTGLVGFDHQFGLFGIAASLESWGNSDTVESIDTRTQLYFQKGGFRAALTGEFRNIDITVTVTTPERTFEQVNRISADAIGGSLRYSGDKFTMYASYLNYDYADDAPRLRAIIVVLDAVDRLPGHTASDLTLANSFLDDTVTAGLDIELVESVFNVEYSRYSGTLDLRDTDSISAALLFPVGDRVDLELRLGRSSTDGFESSTFGGLTFFYYR